MSTQVKVFGAGSIGNHLTHASRTLGWDVHVVDINQDALTRMREDIYPSRYGSWDEAITQSTPEDAPKGGFDLIIAGTPPDYHLDVANAALEETPRAMLVEKPFCKPDLAGAQKFADAAAAAGVSVFVGYDHVVGAAARKVEELLASGDIGELLTLDVEFREHWAGIFAAHPWLSGPADTYLGFWKRGGGASGEHSHAMNLWQHFAHAAGAGRVSQVGALVEYVQKDGADYDSICALNLVTENGLSGRCIQDVVTRPSRKWAVAQGSKGRIEWHCGRRAGEDAVDLISETGDIETFHFPKTRPDDFIAELKHIEAHLAAGTAAQSGLALQRGLDTMLLVAAAHASAQQQGVVQLNYETGCRLEAIESAA